MNWRLDATEEEKKMDYWRTIAVTIHEVRYSAPPHVVPIAADAVGGAKEESEERSSALPDYNVRVCNCVLPANLNFITWFPNIYLLIFYVLIFNRLLRWRQNMMK